MADHEVAKLSNPKGDLGGKKSSIIFLRIHKVIKHEQSQRGTWVAKHVFCKGCFLKTAIFHIFQRILKSLFHTKSNHNQSWAKKAKMAMETIFKHKYRNTNTNTQVHKKAPICSRWWGCSEQRRDRCKPSQTWLWPGRWDYHSYVKGKMLVLR